MSDLNRRGKSNSGCLVVSTCRTKSCSNLIRAGVDRGTAMSISGHRTEAVFERYNISDVGDRKEALIKVGQYNSQQAR